MNPPLYAILPPYSTGRTHHYTGLPPEVSDGDDTHQTLPPSRILIIENESSGVFLFRYSSKGEFAGDTWHESLDDAHHQAAYEFEGTSIDWRPVPPEDTDLCVFLEKLTAILKSPP